VRATASREGKPTYPGGDRQEARVPVRNPDWERGEEFVHEARRNQAEGRDLRLPREHAPRKDGNPRAGHTPHGWKQSPSNRGNQIPEESLQYRRPRTQFSGKQAPHRRRTAGAGIRPILQSLP
jgi:hypothetical protein